MAVPEGMVRAGICKHQRVPTALSLICEKPAISFDPQPYQQRLPDCLNPNIYVSTCVYMYIYICMYIYIYVYTYYTYI